MLFIHHNAPEISGCIRLDGSKSISNRVLVIRALCKESFDIEGLSASNDTQALLAALNIAGGDSTSSPITVDVGAAGTTMRFLTAYFASQSNFKIKITGSARMKARPIGQLVNALRSLGAEIECLENEGFPPLFIKGKKLGGGKVRMPAHVSSQFISALLLVAPMMENGLDLQLVGEVVSQPYIDMTRELAAYFGLQSFFKNNVVSVKPGSYAGKPFRVEADWSAASYHYALAALGKHASLELQGLHKHSLQGDSVLASLMRQFGVETTYTEKGVRLEKLRDVACSSFEYDFVNCPDLAQTFVVLCAALNIPGKFRGLSTLGIKETDRTAALRTELAKLGVRFEGDGANWELHPSPAPLCGKDFGSPPIFDTYHDHRMAMSLAPLGMVVGQGVCINDPMVVNKSYPNFWADLERLGFAVKHRD